MFIYLSKLIPPLLYPLGLVGLLILGAIILQKRAHLQRVVLFTALILLWLSSSRLIVDPLSFWLEGLYPTPDALQRQNLEKGLSQPLAPVIVVLGGGSGPASPPRQIPEIGSNAINRLVYAAYLYKHGAADHILVTCGTIDWMGDQGSPSADMVFVLKELGVPDSAIWVEDRSRNTYENALYSQEILSKEGIQQIILVTSATHMPRSMAIFRKIGFEVIPAPADFNLTQNDMEALVSLNPATQILNLLPNPGNLVRLTTALKEILGIFVYRLRGWV